MTDRETAIFKGFLSGISNCPQHSIEDAAHAVAGKLSGQERIEARDALLERLRIAKKHNPCPDRKDLFKIPEIDTLINVLLIINEPLFATAINSFLEQHHLKKHYREWKSIALYGPNPTGDACAGARGAILEYDKKKGDFEDYIISAVHNALSQSLRKKTTQKLTYELEALMNKQINQGEHPLHWVDKNSVSPDRPVIEKEMLEAIEMSIDKLPLERQHIARYVIGEILRTGKKPSFREMAEPLGFSHARAQQLVPEIFNRLQRILHHDYPQLSSSGVNGWAGFKKIFEELEIQDSLPDGASLQLHNERLEKERAKEAKKRSRRAERG